MSFLEAHSIIDIAQFSTPMTISGRGMSRRSRWACMLAPDCLCVRALRVLRRARAWRWFYFAAKNPKSSLMTEFGPMGRLSGFATSTFLSSILLFHTLRKKSSKTLIVSCSAGQRR
jgi:hypothetical protein